MRIVSDLEAAPSPPSCHSKQIIVGDTETSAACSLLSHGQNTGIGSERNDNEILNLYGIVLIVIFVNLFDLFRPTCKLIKSLNITFYHKAYRINRLHTVYKPKASIHTVYTVIIS